MVLVVPLSALHTHRCAVTLAEHCQRLVVVSAEVTGGERGWIRQPVSLQLCIPLVGAQVNFTVRRLADEARLDR